MILREKMKGRFFEIFGNGQNGTLPSTRSLYE